MILTRIYKTEYRRQISSLLTTNIAGGETCPGTLHFNDRLLWSISDIYQIPNSVERLDIFDFFLHSAHLSHVANCQLELCHIVIMKDNVNPFTEIAMLRSRFPLWSSGNIDTTDAALSSEAQLFPLQSTSD